MMINQILDEIEYLTYSDDLESAWVSERIQAVLFSCKEELIKLKHLVRFGELYPHLFEMLTDLAKREIDGITKVNKFELYNDNEFILDLVSTHPLNKEIKTEYRISKVNNKLHLLHIALDEKESTTMNAATTYSQALMMLAILSSPNADFQHHLNFLNIT